MIATTKHGIYTANIDHDKKTVLVRSRKMDGKEYVFTNYKGYREKAFKMMGLGILFSQGYELEIED